jgi:hypothetical protein
MFKRFSANLVIYAVGMLLGVAALPLTGHAATPVSDATLDFNVSSSSLKAKPIYEGQCPHNFAFKGFFRMQCPAGGIIHFEHSDGTKSRDEKYLNTIASRAANLYYPTTTWSIDKSGSYWIQMHVIDSSGTHITSEKVNFSVVCK